MEPRVNINDLIVVEQLPIIVQHLRGVKANAEREVQDALSLACTEETVQVVKSTAPSLTAHSKTWKPGGKLSRKRSWPPMIPSRRSTRNV